VARLQNITPTTTTSAAEKMRDTDDLIQSSKPCMMVYSINKNVSLLYVYVHSDEYINQ
jgi:hypothetical protein